ncbi:MAG TPA: helix-turn-helix transcriptional regulator [Acidimicrobiales bacterium]|nr:helix-turn-helix transcriptional regulator [Acidimicrobiales bacterium]
MSKEPRTKLGQRLRAARQVAGLTQDALARLSGVHRTYIGALERGEKEPTLFVLVRLAGALGVDPGALVTGIRPDDADRE